MIHREKTRARRLFPLAGGLLIAVLSGCNLLNVDENVSVVRKISSTAGRFSGSIGDGSQFGKSLAWLGDLDKNDEVRDAVLAVGVDLDNDGGTERGAVWLLFLNPDGTVQKQRKISSLEGGFTGPLNDGDWFGKSVAALGDLDGDGVTDLAVGASKDDGGGKERGAVWILFLNADGTVKSHKKIGDSQGGFTGKLDNYDWFGKSLAWLGDLGGNGTRVLAVGADQDDDGQVADDTNRGALWLLYLDRGGNVTSHRKISATQGGFGGELFRDDFFGKSVTALGDLDGNGVTDLAVGASKDDDGGIDTGSVWILFLNADGTVRSEQKISESQGGFTGDLEPEDWFGKSVAALGDLDGDGVEDLAVGAFKDDDGGSNRGAVWILFLNANGTVKSHAKISATRGGFDGQLGHDDSFGISLANLGDLDGDGTVDLAAGASEDDDGGVNRGAVYVMFLRPNGALR